MMRKNELAQLFDHTILKAGATKEDVEKLCNEAREHGFFGVCINTSLLKTAVTCLKGSQVKPVVVVGFPLGACHPDVKAFEAKWAV